MHQGIGQHTKRDPRRARACLRAILAVGAIAILPGCGTLSLAGAVMSAIAGGDGSDIISNPMVDRPPGESVSDALAGTPQAADPACLSALEDLRSDEARGTGTPGAEKRPVAAPSHMDGPACAVEWTCLPGFPEPARMMVCRNADAGTVEAPSEPAINPEDR